MTTEIFVRVYGYLWSGPRACYQYKVDVAPTTDAEAKRIAGDFMSLIDWHVTRVTTEYEHEAGGLSRSVTTYKTLRGWRAGMTNRRYDRAVNG